MTFDNMNIAHIVHIAPTQSICLSRLEDFTSEPSSETNLSTSEPRCGLILATTNPTSSKIQAKRLKEGATNKLKPHRRLSSEVTLLDSKPPNYNTESRDQIAFAVFGF